jgi:CheY-like chemotaxis protein
MSERELVVMVVDDEPLNRDLLRRALVFDYDVEEAPDGSAALQVFEDDGRQVAVLVCDHMMPGLKGTDLVRTVSARWPTTVSILLTGYQDLPEIQQARRDGVVFEIIAKPCMPPDIKQVVERALAEHRRRQAS